MVANPQSVNEILFPSRNGHSGTVIPLAGAVPNSQSLKDLGIWELGNTVVRTWEQDEPAPRRWAIRGLVPKGAHTTVYSDGGQGKSYIVLHAATCAALGHDFVGCPVERCRVLYIDAELDEAEFLRRAYAVARGLGLDRPPEGLYYWRLPAALTPQVIETAATIIKAGGIDLTVLDSLTVAMHNADPSLASDVTGVLKGMESWGTVISIDHIAKPAAGANMSNYRPFGSAFKFNMARSVIQVLRAEGGGLTLRQSKNNFGSLTEPIHLAVEFSPGQVTYTPIQGQDARLAGIENHLPAIDKVALALADYPEGATVEQLAEDLEMAPKTVRNHLTALRQGGRADSANGRWAPIPDSRSYKESGIGNPAEQAIQAVIEAGGYLRVEDGRLSWATPDVTPAWLRDEVRRHHAAIKDLVVAAGGEVAG